ncbi:hypothetical protein HNO52_00615 [Billgrantia diversa]|uniref:hypothetical protein n=1 Tax=Halomonas sp. MCCC 1A13316 TaxID=2733487 RepID=UPI0018A57EA2|nr:hypothetical protein [Halomonas sp. MCCC 1A13316]QOR37166.1 hypothetical protein HNO52_00615 [Halomonas sp. MCCC 1A13316]
MQASAWLGGSLAALAFTTALAAEGPTGYRSAEFGMSYGEVMTELDRDAAVVNLAGFETEEGDRLIDGELQDEDAPQTDLRYVFPAGDDALALVVTFHPDVAERERVIERLVANHGEPWEEEMAAWWFEQLQGEMPETPQSLMVWGGDGDEADHRGRFVRLWTFEDYLSVEYLDTQRFR